MTDASPYPSRREHMGKKPRKNSSKRSTSRSKNAGSTTMAPSKKPSEAPAATPARVSAAVGASAGSVGSTAATQPSTGQTTRASSGKGATPVRRSIMERISEKNSVAAPLIGSSVDTLSTPVNTTASFRVDVTGELVPDAFASVPVEVERSEPLGDLDPATAAAYHLLTLPEHVSGDDLEALTVSVWNEAGWLGPGVLRLREGITLEGPWSTSLLTSGLDLPADTPQVWRLVCPPQRGAAPLPEVQEFDVWARAFPDGMPVGSELKVLQVLTRIARRLNGAVRIAGSGYIMRPDPEAAVNLRIFSDRWLEPNVVAHLLEECLPGLRAPQPLPETEDAPYAFLAPAGARSQILVGVRQETYMPRALRWELWAKGPKVYVYELVWVPPEDLVALEKHPTRIGLLERRRALRAIETAAGALATALPQSAIIDEDGFLLGLDEPPQEEEQPRP